MTKVPNPFNPKARNKELITKTRKGEGVIDTPQSMGNRCWKGGVERG